MQKKLALSIVFACWLTVAYMQERVPLPNMVIFIADDLGVKDIGPYGNDIVHTPNLDKLSRQSLVFDRAFAASPTCGPSRSSLFTAMYPMKHGAHGNHSGVKTGTTSMVQRLVALGYRVAIAGKLHVGPQEVFPFERIEGTNVPEQGHEEKPGLFYDLNLAPVNEWLGQQRADKPFVLIVADHSPHVVWPETPTYNPKEVDIPPIHIDTDDTRRARARYYTDITKMDTNVGKLMDLLDAHGMASRSILMFTADQGPQWAFGKWGLYDYGVQVPLMVRWPEHIEGGVRTAALVSHVDVAPTMVAIAHGKPADNIDGRSFLAVLENPQAKHRERVFASHTGDRTMNRSPMRMLRTDRYKYIVNIAPDILYNTHMDKATDHDGGREYWPSWRIASFRNPQAAAVLWRYHNRPTEELYDVQADPWERVNLAADPAFADLLAQFREEMAAIRKEQGDHETGPENLSAPTNNGEHKGPVAPYIF
ncbi:sulfatase family protein [Parapedobacter sp. 10938]|uniref:sulfatase family protein n=1 Tax=Parapedobacter flavus TaxID=3110225 RepID=UPI002DB55F9F|nr:sulfatase [Parapedobacter sp. 10938]MEC3878202.1 sulfatase [Parapedobacter sp. 10938]